MGDAIGFMPDWPILRHLTWREAHMLEMGLWPGIGIGFAVAGRHWLVAVGLVTLVRRRLRDEDQTESGPDSLKGYVRDAWYSVAGGVAGMLFSLWLAGVLGL